jgi:hypothetical protein
MSALRVLVVLISLVTLLFVRPVHARDPPASATESLLYDMRKIVDVQRSGGWKIDRYEYEAMMPDALLSVCQATDEIRSAALTEARREVVRLGGRIYELKDLLFASRVANLLEQAMRRAPTECSPWMEPQQDFKALQAGVNRFILSMEGSGPGMIQYASIHPDGTTGFRATHGAGGRLMLGWGFGHHWSLRVGSELNLNMLVRRAGNTTDLPIQIQGALPIVVRYTKVSWHYNLEMAPLLMLTDKDPLPRPGGRVGVMIGISRLKKRHVIPWAGMGVTVEMFPGMDGDPMLVNLAAGLRAGIDWDF